MPKKKPSNRVQSASTNVVIPKSTKVAKAPSWIKASEASSEMTTYLEERHEIESATSRVGSPAQQRAARDSTIRGFNNLMRKKYGG